MPEASTRLSGRCYSNGPFGSAHELRRAMGSFLRYAYDYAACGRPLVTAQVFWFVFFDAQNELGLGAKPRMGASEFWWFRGVLRSICCPSFVIDIEFSDMQWHWHPELTISFQLSLDDLGWHIYSQIQ